MPQFSELYVITIVYLFRHILRVSIRENRHCSRTQGYMFTQTLPHALSEKLDEDSLELNSSVLSLASNQQGNPLRNNWTVTYSKEGSQTAEKHFDAVILTVRRPFYL